MIRKYCIIKLEKERAGIDRTHSFPKRHPTSKVVGRQLYYVGIKPTKLDRFSFANWSGLFLYNKLLLYKMTMYFTSSINCFNAKKP